MGKSKLVVALGTTVAMAALPLLTASMASASSGSNSGSSVTRSATTKAAEPSASGKFKTFKRAGNNRATERYIGKTCVIDLSGIADFTIVASVEGCGQTVSFSTGMDKRSVPGSWGTWGSPPYTESATPNLLYSNAQTTVTMTLSNKTKIGGAEAEPNPFEVHAISATYMLGAKDRGTITRDCDGNAGAKLLGAKTKSFDTIVYASDVDFAIAQIRVGL